MRRSTLLTTLLLITGLPILARGGWDHDRRDHDRSSRVEIGRPCPPPRMDWDHHGERSRDRRHDDWQRCDNGRQREDGHWREMRDRHRGWEREHVYCEDRPVVVVPRPVIAPPPGPRIQLWFGF